MIDIDVERLKWDADYWDEVAPTPTARVMDTVLSGRVCSRSLGGTGERCSGVGIKDLPQPKYELVNTLDNTVVKNYHRKPTVSFKNRMLKGKPETLGKLQIRVAKKVR